MFRRIALAGTATLLVAAGLALVGTAATWRSAEALTNCTTNTQALSGVEQQLMTLINNHRLANGRQALKASPNLSRAAAWMAEDLSASGAFSHTDSLGRSAFARVQQCGYASTGAGENIAMTGSAAGAFQLFVTSSGHNTNMLNSSWTVIGVGQAGAIWVVDFGSVDDSGQPWTSGSGALPTNTATPVPGGTGGNANPGGGFVPTSPSGGTGGIAPSFGGTGGAGPSSGGTEPPAVGAPRTVLPGGEKPQHALPANVPVKRAMMAMISAE